MIDTHCHLTDERLIGQIESVLARAAAAGVTRMITVGTTLSDARSAVALCAAHRQLRCVVGIHPNHSHESAAQDVDAIRDLAGLPCVAALGEMGLDYHHAFANRATQFKFFELQLQLAAELQRNVVIHCREAIDDALQIMRNFPKVTGVFHCFTGSAAEAEKILSAGHWISYTGAITFRKNDALRDCVRHTPRDRLMVETDAPYLTPEPMRSQKTNEPALVIHTAAAVANAWGTDIDEVDRVTTANARRFYGVE